MIIWAKTIHIGAIMLWCAGLMVLPMIYAQRNGLRGEPLHELHRFARSLFIRFTCPAAFVAIIAGTMLIFLRDVFTVWMALKLAFVGMLVAIHMWQGHVILTVFEKGETYARWRHYLATSATVTVVTAVLIVVLAKPHIGIALPADWKVQPGGLQSLLDNVVPIP